MDKYGSKCRSGLGILVVVSKRVEIDVGREEHTS